MLAVRSCGPQRSVQGWVGRLIHVDHCRPFSMTTCAIVDLCARIKLSAELVDHFLGRRCPAVAAQRPCARSRFVQSRTSVANTTQQQQCRLRDPFSSLTLIQQPARLHLRLVVGCELDDVKTDCGGFGWRTFASSSQCLLSIIVLSDFNASTPFIATPSV